MEAFNLPIGRMIEAFINFFVDNYAFITKAMSEVLEGGFSALVNVMMMPQPWLLILILTLLAWGITRKWNIALLALIGLMIIWGMGLWEPTISTIALVLISTLCAVIIAVPLGILTALFKPVNRVIMPILDLMQTMPAFVYLIPAIPFFGLGPVGAIFASVIFSMPPTVRLTCLGILQVPGEMSEAAEAFGCSRWQKLVKIQLPLATPTILAGVNQTIMLALSMVVIAAMIGAKGLGGEVWRAIQRLEVGRGFEAGIGIVILAIIFDRVVQRAGKRA